ncbi:MAG: alpha/beta fold hydrolase [bacterium]|nr:alpha/beta fold hydrolase [bacterium]
MIQKQFVKNSDEIDLYVQVEGSEDALKNVIFVHGNGVDMHGDYFDAIVPVLIEHGYRTIRFDLRGCGQSKGKQEDGNFATYARDVLDIVEWTKKEFIGDCYLIAHSMGCSVTAKAQPNGIIKAVLTGIPNSDSEFRVNNFKERILSKGGTFNENDISIYKHSNGRTQKIGHDYWRELRDFKAIEKTTEFANKTPLLIIRPIDDQIVPNVGIEEYGMIPNAKLIKLPGNHQFDNPKDQIELFKTILDFFSE